MDNHPNLQKKKSKPKFGRRKQRKRKASVRKFETDPLLVVTQKTERDRDSHHQKQQQEDLLLVGQVEEVEKGVGGGCNGGGGDSSLIKPSSSMPETAVTSRSKRLLRGVTTTPIAYTDRKTRSTSTTHQTSISNSIQFVEDQSSPSGGVVGSGESRVGENVEISPNNQFSTKLYSNGESTVSGKDSVFLASNDCNTHKNETSDHIRVANITSNGSISSIVENKSMKSELKEDEEEIDEASIIQPSVAQGKEKIVIAVGLDESLNKNKGTEQSFELRTKKVDDELSDNPNSTVVIKNATILEDSSSSSSLPLFIGEQHVNQSRSATSGGGLPQPSQKHVTVPPSKSGHGGAGGFSAKKLKLVEERKLTTLAPMLLMNNLPYMGELTFDTRPRRGRKPKKADICHLISKNYGIHFPNSYTNTPYTGPPTTTTTLSAQKGCSSVVGKSSGGGGVVKSTNKHGGSNNKKKGSVSSCPTSWNIVPSTPPALLPLHNTAVTSHKSSRLTSSVSSSSCRTSKAASRKNTLEKSFESQNIDSCTSRYGAFEEPLNLCVRDANDSSSHKSSGMQSHITLNTLSKNCSEIMNLKLPLLSSNLFSDFQLIKPSADKSSHNNNNNNNNTRKSRGTFGEEGSKKFKSSNSSAPSNSSNNSGGGFGNVDSGENSVRDLGLVNQLNFQLNLAKCAQLSSEPSSSLLNKVRENSFGFTSPDSGVSSVRTKSESKKGKKRGSQVVVKQETGGSGDASSAGGSLFGQTDSGSSSGAQVSICKFKFTGGAKPSLQEKKMLSVDSGGNFRFYTDKDKVGGASVAKSTKAQSILSSPSASGSGGDGEVYQRENQGCHYAYSALPKSAKSMSVCMPVRPASLKCLTTTSPSQAEGGSKMSSSSSSAAQGTSASSLQKQSGGITPTVQDLNNLHLDVHGRLAFPSSHYLQGEDGYSSSQSSESGPSNSSLMLGGSSTTSAGGPFELDAFKRSSRKLLRLKRKRRTRKSLMREKLEKTFKEKGFLIQTQQLESAEGATYCKFRQLRKFTRYLFRSWRDYLPDNVKEINSGGQVQNSSHGAPQPEWSVSVHPAATTTSGGEADGPEDIRIMADPEVDLSTTTTNSQLHPEFSDDCEEDDEDDDDDDEETRMELVPEVTLITQPSSPATIPDDNNTDSDGSDDEVDVEQIDDRGRDDFSSDNNDNSTPETTSSHS